MLVQLIHNYYSDRWLCLGTDMMVVFLKQDGAVAWVRNRLKIWVKTLAYSAANQEYASRTIIWAESLARVAGNQVFMHFGWWIVGSVFPRLRAIDVVGCQGTQTGHSIGWGHPRRLHWDSYCNSDKTISKNMFSLFLKDNLWQTFCAVTPFAVRTLEKGNLWIIHPLSILLTLYIKGHRKDEAKLISGKMWSTPWTCHKSMTETSNSQFKQTLTACL